MNGFIPAQVLGSAADGRRTFEQWGWGLCAWTAGDILFNSLKTRIYFIFDEPGMLSALTTWLGNQA
jgi:hypothetical protein